MAEFPDAGEVWGARFHRAWQRVGADGKVVRDLYQELLEASGDAEGRRLWGELGELLGIGPPPDDFLA
jgi:hypothetical protein